MLLKDSSCCRESKHSTRCGAEGQCPQSMGALSWPSTQPSDRRDDGHWDVMDMVTGTVNSGVRGFEINDPSSTQIRQFRKGIMEPWREVIAASKVLPKAVFRTSFSTANPGDLGRKGHVLSWCFLTLQGGMRSEDSHTCRCLPNFSVPQLELP